MPPPILWPSALAHKSPFRRGHQLYGPAFFTWTPSEAQGGATYTFATIVTDNGVPPLSATQSVTFVVLKPIRLPSSLLIINLTNNELTSFHFHGQRD